MAGDEMINIDEITIEKETINFINDLRDKMPTISEMTKKIDAHDLEVQMHAFVDLLNIEIDDKANRLDHRANMMRLQAAEFNKMAEEIRHQKPRVIHHSMTLLQLTKEIEELLHTHAHIEPKKVTNGR